MSNNAWAVNEISNYQYVEIPDIEIKGNDNFKITFEIKRNQNSNNRSYILSEEVASSFRYLGISSTNFQYRWLSVGNGAFDLPVDTDAAQRNIYQVEKNGDTFTFRCNGQDLGTVVDSSVGDQFWRVIGSASTTSPTFTLYSLQLEINDKLVRDYRNEIEGTGSTLYERIGNQHGTLVNLATDGTQWLGYYDPTLDVNITDWQKRAEITVNHTLQGSLEGFTALMTEDNLPSDIWSIAEPSPIALNFRPNSDQVELDSLITLLDTTEWRIEVDFAAFAPINRYGAYRLLGGVTNNDPSLTLEPSGGDSFRLTVDYGFSGKMQVVSSGRSDIFNGQPYKIVFKRSGDLHTFEVAELDISESGSTTLLPDNGTGIKFITRETGQSWSCRGLRFYSDSQGNNIVHDYNPTLSGGIGTTLVDIEGGNNGTLINFPTDNNQWIIENGGGRDLRACLNQDGVGRLPLEIVEFDTVNQKAIIWTRLPNFNNGDSFWLAYGKPDEVQPEVYERFGRNEVWLDYCYVLHLDDTANPVDSSGNMTFTKSVDGTETTALAKIGNGADIDTGGGFVTTDTNRYDFTAGYTISQWTRIDSHSFWGSISRSHQNLNITRQNSDPHIRVVHGSDRMTFNNYVDAFYDVGNMSRKNVRWDSSTNDISLILNTTVLDTQVFTSTPENNNGVLTLFHENSNVGIDGLVDELRHCKLPLSDDHLEAEYANQNSPSTFWTTSASEDTTGGGGVLSVSSLSSLTYLESVTLNVLSKLTLNELTTQTSLESVGVASGARLTLNKLTEAQAISNTSIDGLYQLNVDKLAFQQTLDNTSLGVTYGVNSIDLGTNQILDNTSIQVDYSLGAEGVIATQFMTSVSLDSAYILSVQGLSSTQQLDSLSVIPSGTLSLGGLGSGQALDQTELVQQHNLVSSSLIHEVNLNQVNLGQGNNLTPTKVDLSTSLDNLSLIVNGFITPAIVESNNILSQTILAVLGSVSGLPLRGIQDLSSLTLTQQSQIALDNITNNLSVGQTTVLVDYIVELQSLIQENSTDESSLTLRDVVSVAGLENIQSLSSPEYTVDLALFTDSVSNEQKLSLVFFGILPEIDDYALTFSRNLEGEIKTSIIQIKFGE